MRHALMVHILRDIEGQNEVHRLVLKAMETALTLLKAEGLDSELAAKAVRRFRKNRQHFRSQHNALPSKNELCATQSTSSNNLKSAFSIQKATTTLTTAIHTPDNLIIIGGDVLQEASPLKAYGTTSCENRPPLTSTQRFSPPDGLDLIAAIRT